MAFIFRRFTIHSKQTICALVLWAGGVVAMCGQFSLQSSQVRGVNADNSIVGVGRASALAEASGNENRSQQLYQSGTIKARSNY